MAKKVFKEKTIIKTDEQGVVTTKIIVGDPTMVVEDDGRTFNITNHSMKDEIEPGIYEVKNNQLQRRSQKDIDEFNTARFAGNLQKKDK